MILHHYKKLPFSRGMRLIHNFSIIWAFSSLMEKKREKIIEQTYYFVQRHINLQQEKEFQGQAFFM
jgi:hypothetical protein